ncbi:MAG: type I restriction enzyme subunit R domain-containing protein [Streptosporangiaceae bacterium]
MLLTGFDSPPLHTLYLDRPRRGAALMQVLARVNRAYRDRRATVDPATVDPATQPDRRHRRLRWRRLGWRRWIAIAIATAIVAVAVAVAAGYLITMAAARPIEFAFGDGWWPYVGGTVGETGTQADGSEQTTVLIHSGHQQASPEPVVRRREPGRAPDRP